MSAAATTGADRPNVHKRMPAGAAVAQALAYLGRVGAIVVAHATDKADARQLLDVLGLRELLGVAR